jgi:streptogramin lyase
MEYHQTFIGAAVAISLLAAGAGAMAAITTPWSSPFEDDVGLEGPVRADLDYGANSRLEQASVDPAVEFPEALSELPNPPTHLAVDPKTGDLWFVLFQYNGETNDLYRYRSDTQSLTKQSVPAGTGSELFSAIAVDSRGHVISAEGDVVLDVDPAGTYRTLSLPPPVNLAKRPGWDGTYVIDMALSDTGRVYLTRMNTAAVTELDLGTGATREIPVPASLGQLHYIELSGTEIWMTTWADTATAPVQAAVLSLDDGGIHPVAAKGIAFGAARDGTMYLSTQGSSSLARADAKGATPVTIPAEKTSLSGLRDYLAVDDSRRRVWMAGGGGITSLEISSSATEYYDLPVTAGVVPFSIPASCPGGCDFRPRDEITQVGGIAIAPNGDLFFSDMSFNRIGIVHPR